MLARIALVFTLAAAVAAAGIATLNWANGEPETAPDWVLDYPDVPKGQVDPHHVAGEKAPSYGRYPAEGQPGGP